MAMASVRQWAADRLPWSKPATRPAAPRQAAPARTGGRETEPTGLVKTWANVRKQWREIRIELRKVTWPTPRQTRNLTALVVAVSVGVGLFLGGLDLLLARLFSLSIR